jgi:hypothetical protein
MVMIDALMQELALAKNTSIKPDVRGGWGSGSSAPFHNLSVRV